METSGEINGTMTAREVVEEALTLLSVNGGGQTVDAEDGALGLRRLNWMLKSLQADGVNMWRESERSLFVAAGSIETLITPRVVDIQSARIVTGYERTLARWERGEYDQLPNKTSTGIPSCYFLDQRLDQTYMRLWPVPYQDMTVIYTAARVIEDVTDLDQTLDVPQMWLEAVCYNLAVKLYPSFGGERIEMVKSEADRLYSLMLNHDRPASVYMGGYSR